MRVSAFRSQGVSGCIRRSTSSSTRFTPRFSSWVSTARWVMLLPRKRTTACSRRVMMTAGAACVPTSSMFTTFQLRAVSRPKASAVSKTTVGSAARRRTFHRIAAAQSKNSTRHTSAAYPPSNQSDAPGRPDTRKAHSFIPNASPSAQKAMGRRRISNKGRDPKFWAARPSSAAPRLRPSIGPTIQRTATPDTTAQTVALISRSTSTGKVAAEAQKETQSASHTPPSRRRRSSTGREGFFSCLFFLL